jgi:hypothetical protein
MINMAAVVSEKDILNFISALTMYGINRPMCGVVELSLDDAVPSISHKFDWIVARIQYFRMIALVAWRAIGRCLVRTSRL